MTATKKINKAAPIAFPADARVREIAKSPSPAFSATLSPAELLLAKETGYQPIAPVTGTSVVYIGREDALMSRSRESPRLTMVLEGMWKAAIARMQEQARLLGASGVVATDIQAWGMEEDEGGQDCLPGEKKPLERGDLLRVSAMGTAVRMVRLPKSDTPFMCGLTGQEVCALTLAGFRPIGFAYGNCVWSQVSRQYLADRRNKEVTGMTLAIYRARRQAIERAQDMAAKHGGEGILDLKVRFKVLEREKGTKSMPGASVALSFFAAGTIVASSSSGRIPAIDYSLLLSDRSSQGEH